MLCFIICPPSTGFCFNEGSESYIPMNAPGTLTISQLTVSDQNGNYEMVSDWNIDWSFEEKARKCGIHDTDSGYEICFGISRYGQNRYAIEYKRDNAVGGYSDRDGVNFRFVNDGMNATPTDAKVEIRLADGTPITDETAFSGSDYDDTGEEVSTLEAIVTMLLSIGLPIGLMIWFFRMKKKCAEKKSNDLQSGSGISGTFPTTAV